MTCSRSAGGRREIVERHLAERPAIARIDRVGPGQDAVEASSRPRELPVVEIQIAELLVVADRRVVDDRAFELLDPLAAREHLERPAQQAGVGHDLDDDVDERAKAAAHQDDPQPERVRPPPHEVQDGDRLEQEAVRIEETEHPGARL